MKFITQMKSSTKESKVDVMSSQKVNHADRIGEAFALQVLSEHFGTETFIGSSIELKVEELASIVYKEIRDPDFFGATITLKRDNRKYVLLNTSQTLRHRYFTAAHEFWHVLNINSMIKDDIDPERAADRFAAALMLPESLVRSLIRSLQEDDKKEQEEKKIVIRISDISSAPYVAVVKRLVELKLTDNKGLAELSDKDWTEIRRELNIVESPLDQPQRINRFTDYEERIAQEVQDDNLNFIEASKRLATVSPEKSAEYAQLRAAEVEKVMDEIENDEDDDFLDALFETRRTKK
ncbi:ImmA/IrrE family metallo-endopeptidase [Lentibacillus sp. Marseille-P4043]|uniref:ImmA/IrrE family metallo-endopeptidase n=1 Tax=Lentibacillus sp. Marseille-P4043 TaxID=2040293 RepID=UPI00131A4F00|nr:ImmA/IrrE family metallo-endopeptidase [Lentibacillus sp. Marseille-P4043]